MWFLQSTRDFHATTHENGALNTNIDVQPGVATVQPYASLPALHLAHNANAVDANGFWYRNPDSGEQPEYNIVGSTQPQPQRPAVSRSL